MGINDWAQSWYIKTGKPRATYVIELGRIFPDGRFFPLAQSNGSPLLRMTFLRPSMLTGLPGGGLVFLAKDFSGALPGKYQHLSSWAPAFKCSEEGGKTVKKGYLAIVLHAIFLMCAIWTERITWKKNGSMKLLQKPTSP